jgi:hypothetical protein
MKRFLAVVACALLLVSCGRQGVRSFWSSHSIDYTHIRAAEDQFADFAELAVASRPEDACAAIDSLFDRLLEDEVAYYIYAEWVDGAFYSPLSPCRNAALYSKAVERMVTDGVFSQDDCEPFLQKREWIQYNQKGAKATVPGRSSFKGRTLVLVLDLGCPSCREALEKLASDPAWEDVEKWAVGLGYGPAPDVPDWDYLFPGDGTAVFDIHMTPVYFVVAADGTVETSYTLAL